MSPRNAFTLVEVAVAGSLIGLCVLTAVSIIPAGLRTQNEARMRAVAAATVMSLSAQAGVGAGTVYNVDQRLTAYTGPEMTALEIEGWDSSGAIAVAPTGLSHATTVGAAGDLSRRLAYSLETGGGVRVITVWLLSKDPDTLGKRRARYLTTFTERQ